uniref:hypothetical protein n=1 Tax=Pseudomonas sp. EL_65y_Pfl2_R96 TaxID=3088699 RepID=UPI0030D79824
LFTHYARPHTEILTVPKVMMLATAMWNKGIPKIERAQMLATHAKAMTDTYYRQMLSTIISMAP